MLMMDRKKRVKKFPDGPRSVRQQLVFKEPADVTEIPDQEATYGIPEYLTTFVLGASTPELLVQGGR